MYFRNHTEREIEREALRHNACTICGARPQIGHDIFSAVHDKAVHEVFALEVWGMKSVRFDCRDKVQGWSDGTLPLPNNDEFIAMVTA